MTSRHYAISRHEVARNAPTRPPEGNALQRPIDGTMDSEYGSGVSLTALSDYGSDIEWDDVQENTALGDLLVKLAATAPNEIAYPSIESDVHNVEPDLQPKYRPLAVHWDERDIQSSPVVARALSMEHEYEAASRRAFSGMTRNFRTSVAA